MKRPTRRATAAMLAAVATMAAACGGGDGGTDENASAADAGGGAVTVTMSEVPGVSVSLPVYVAQQEGLFADHGIELDLVNVQGGGAAITALSSGSVDVAWAQPSLIEQAVQQGNTFDAFCGLTDRSGVRLYARAGSDLASAEEAGSWQEAVASWDGSLMGVPAIGGVVGNFVTAMGTEAGIGPDGLPQVPVGGGPTAIDALGNETVDIIFVSPFVVQMIEASGDGKLLLDTVEDGPETVGQNPTMLMADEGWLADNAEAAEGFCAAVAEAIELINAPEGAEALRAVLADDFDITDDALIEEVESSVLEQYSPTIVPCEQYQTTIELNVEAGLIESIDSCDHVLAPVPSAS
jgi:NitT/TauT family transport system substrate-binding protein